MSAMERRLAWHTRMRMPLCAYAWTYACRWPEFSGQGLMQLAMGFAGLRLLPSAAWMQGLVQASQQAAAQGKLAPHEAVCACVCLCVCLCV